MTPAVEVGKGVYDARFLAAIDWAIQVNEEDRPQSIAAWREAFSDGQGSGVARLPVSDASPSLTPAAILAEQAAAGSAARFGLLSKAALAVVGVAVLGAGLWMWIRGVPSSRIEPTVETREESGSGQSTQPAAAEQQRAEAATRAGAERRRKAEEERRRAQEEATSRELRNSIGMEFVLIEPGTFEMGSRPGEAGRDDDETLYRVTLSQPYYLGKYEVTQGQWEAVMGSNPSLFDNCGRTCPVETVSWGDAQEFIVALNRREGVETYRSGCVAVIYTYTPL